MCCDPSPPPSPQVRCAAADTLVNLCFHGRVPGEPRRDAAPNPSQPEQTGATLPAIEGGSSRAVDGEQDTGYTSVDHPLVQTMDQYGLFENLPVGPAQFSCLHRPCTPKVPEFECAPASDANPNRLTYFR